MKNIIIILALFLNAPKLSFTQDNCTYVHDEAAQQIFEKTRALISSTPVNRTINYVPIQFHIVGNDDGSGYLKQIDLIHVMCLLNQNFENTDIQFYIHNLSFNYIDNSFYHNNIHEIDASLYSVENVINIYIGADNINDISNLGVYHIYGDYITLTQIEFLDEHPDLQITHDIGHFFNLPHTFTICDDFIFGNCPANPTCNGQEVELVDGSNCSTAGDKFCDTPADPGIFNFECEPYTGTACDPNGDSYSPDQNNFMAYLNSCSDYHFSEEQKEHMYYNLLSRINTNVTLVNENNSTNPVEDTIDIISTNSSNGSVTLIWTYTTNATNYLVEISRTPLMHIEYQSKTVDINSATFTDLTPNKKYFYRITPFNDLGACNSPSGIDNYFTTNFNDDPPLFEWDIYTDPYNINTNRLIIDDPEINDITISLLSFDGQINYATNHALIAGKNIIDLKTNDLTPGIYFVLVSSKQNKDVKKIIIY